MKPFKPLLACNCEDISKLKYPLLLSEKVDGIRMSVHNGVCMSRSMKPIPSAAVQAKFGKPEYEGFDGEIIYGHKNAKDVFNKSTRVCMSHNLPDDFEVSQIKYFVFDKIGDGKYTERYESILSGWPEVTSVHRLPYFTAECSEDVTRMEAEFLALGAEGVMLRSPNGRYKQGRSTLKEGILLKVKQFVDEEATVVDFEEKMHNANEATIGELGQTKRSSHQENMIPCGTLGALVVCSEKWGEFKIGTGFNDEQRKQIWEDRGSLIGQLVKFKYFAVGIKTLPRFPTFVGFRSKLDM